MDEPVIEGRKALAHPARFAILQTLAGGERNVGEIENLAGIGQPALSQQLSVLRKAGFVTTRRAAKLVFYKLDPEALENIASSLGQLLPEGVKPANGTSNPHRSNMGAAVFATMNR